MKIPGIEDLIAGAVLGAIASVGVVIIVVAVVATPYITKDGYTYTFEEQLSRAAGKQIFRRNDEYIVITIEDWKP